MNNENKLWKSVYSLRDKMFPSNQIAVQISKIILALLNINFNCSHLIKFQFYSYCPIWVALQLNSCTRREQPTYLPAPYYLNEIIALQTLIGRQKTHLSTERRLISQLPLTRYSLLSTSYQRDYSKGVLSFSDWSNKDNFKLNSLNKFDY